MVVDIDWRAFNSDEYLSNIPVTVQQTPDPELFEGKKTGTRLEITGLRATWNRSMVRELHRAVNSICSPFRYNSDRKNGFDDRLRLDTRTTGGFSAELKSKTNEDWLKGLVSVDTILDYSLFRARCRITNRELQYQYKFVPLKAMSKVEKREAKALGTAGKRISFSDDVYGDLLEK